MSADLFAEFNNLAQNPPPAQEQSPGGRQSNQPPTPGEARQDPFGLVQSSGNPAPTCPPTRQWPPLQSQPGGPASGWAPLSQPSAVSPQAAGDDDDGWGDFEVAEPTTTAARVSRPLAFEVCDPPSAKTLARVSTIDLMTNTLVHVVEPGHPESRSPPLSSQPRTNPKPRAEAASSDPNVLFDAGDFELQGGEDDDDGDDFGDFETAAHPPPPQPMPAPCSAPNLASSMDLLGLDDPPQPSPPPRQDQQPLDRRSGPLDFGAVSSVIPLPAPKPPSLPNPNPVSDLGVKTTGNGSNGKGKGHSPVTAWPSTADGCGPRTTRHEDDEWAAWDDDPGADVSTNKEDMDNAQPRASWDWDNVDSESKTWAAKLSDSDPPPANVPPPSVILSAFPELFSSGDPLFKLIAGQSTCVRQQTLANPKAAQFLRGYVLLGTTAARVIAGRKHRWHRDKILAKSMSISGAGSKGMKLAGVDKTQSTREEREAADVVAAWREHVGRLRAAVAAANASGKASLTVPELSENMHVSTAKLVPTARMPCIICGLKREERVTKVDYDVEDSFGEWWVEHWGHRACKNFWVEHEHRLRQR